MNKSEKLFLVLSYLGTILCCILVLIGYGNKFYLLLLVLHQIFITLVVCTNNTENVLVYMYIVLFLLFIGTVAFDVYDIMVEDKSQKLINSMEYIKSTKTLY